MKFDVVIGNPPYNKGMDLDFVKLGFDLCTKYCVMITPAKWQTAEANQRTVSKNMNYGQFREQLVPHMSKVVFYPDCKDVFNIAIPEGITYYMLDKREKHDLCRVQNICSIRNEINSTEERNIHNMETLWNIGQKIINIIGRYKKFEFHSLDGKKYEVWANDQVSFGQTARSYLFSSTDNLLVTGVADIIDTSKKEKFSSNTSKRIFSSDNLDECKSFISWYYSKIVRFMVLINVSKRTGVLNNETFRFVPAPPSGKFDHIYTDEELYKAFNLPQEYIDVIEAVIKERK